MRRRLAAVAVMLAALAGCGTSASMGSIVRAIDGSPCVYIDFQSLAAQAASYADGGLLPAGGREVIDARPPKPLGAKAYGSIPHLPGSRMGPGEHTINFGQSQIAQHKTRDKHDKVWVQEKLDGSCVAVARVGGELLALGRAGHLAASSPYPQHVMFADWVRDHAWRFAFLREGERVVGEWLAQAHGTRYDLTLRDPFVAFDLMTGTARASYEDFCERLGEGDAKLWTPHTTSGPLSIEDAMAWVGERGFYGALDRVEGVVWRVERRGVVDFLVKYVRPDKVDGSYLDSVTGLEPVWNWRS